MLVHNKFSCVYGVLGLDVKNTPRTVKVLGSNLTGPVFFSNLIYSVSKHCFPALLSNCRIVFFVVRKYFCNCFR